MNIINPSQEKKILKSPNEKSNKEKVKFLFYDETSLDFDKNLIASMSPSILENIPKYNNYYIIRAPYGITKEDFSTFLFIYSNISYHNGPQIIGSNCKKLFSILKLMDFFNNEKFNIQIITYIIIPELNSNIAIDLIIFSYDKLCYFSERGREADNAYFELFYQALEELSKNEMMIIKNIDKLKSLDTKIIEELIQKTFRNLIFGKYLIEKKEDSTINNNHNSNIDNINQMNYFDENEVTGDYFERKKLEEAKNNNNSSNDNSKIINLNNLKNLIDFLIKINNLDNIFSLLTKEYMSLLSSESISEIQSMPNPSFQVKIPITLYENYYEEFPLDININNQILTLVIFYKIGDKSINACIKLSSKTKEKNKIINSVNYNKYSFEILTFLTNVVVTKGKDQKITTQNNLTSLTNNKSMYSILKIPHFNVEINHANSNENTVRNLNIYYSDLNNNTTCIGVSNIDKDNDFFMITVQIKLCYIYSVISSYLLQDFNNYANDKNISKLSKQLFILLLKNQKLNKKNENNLVKSILLWLDDEINIKEDISEVFYLIKWEEIDDDLIFELLIKYSHIILSDDTLENHFIDIYLNKYGQNNIVKTVVVKLFKAIKKVEYHKLFCQMKNDEKQLENLENYKAQKTKFEKQNSIKKRKKIEQEKKYNSEYTQTEPDICSLGVGSSHNIEEIKENPNCLKNKNCFWNVSRIKNFVKGKNSSNISKSNNSLNEVIKNNSKNNAQKKDKENNEIPRPKIKNKSNSPMMKSQEIAINQKKVKNNRNDNNSSNKELNKNVSLNSNKDKQTVKTNNSVEVKGNEKHSIKRSKSNKSLSNHFNKKDKNIKKNKKDYSNPKKKNNNNISLMKKPENKIKEMLIFPYNFSALKKFQNNFIHKNNNNNKNNIINNMSLSSKNIFNKNNINNNSNKTKSNRSFIKSEIDLSNKKFSLEKNKYNTGRNNAKINDKSKNIKNRPFSETRIKINIGIIKEICFMNNNNI
jgi:hypothetical protein